jgi:hypothetical protein
MNDTILLAAAGLFALYMLTQKKKADDETAPGAAPEEEESFEGGSGYGGGYGGGGWFVDPTKNIEQQQAAMPSNVRTIEDLEKVPTPKLGVDLNTGRDDWLNDSVLANQERMSDIYGAGFAALAAADKDEDEERASVEKKKSSGPFFDSTPTIDPELVPQRLRPSGEVEHPAETKSKTSLEYIGANQVNPADFPKIARTQIAPLAKVQPRTVEKPKTTSLLRQIKPSDSETQISAQRPTLWNLWGMV